jgi:small subunit ribosomal protein S7
MSRRSIVKKRYPLPDSQYNSCLVSLLTARILQKGKKRLAENIVLETFALIQEKTTDLPLKIFESITFSNPS